MAIKLPRVLARGSIVEGDLQKRQGINDDSNFVFILGAPMAFMKVFKFDSTAICTVEYMDQCVP